MYFDVWPFPFAFGSSLIYWLVSAALFALFVTALVFDTQARRWVWLVADIAFPPIGIVRGLLIWLEKN